MAIREIKTYPDSVLKDSAEPVEDLNDELQTLIDDMIETMYAAPGIGLAANQVGVPKRVVVLDITASDRDGRLIILVNPEIVEACGKIDSEEGCLSVPDYTTVIKRAETVRVKGLDRHGSPLDIHADGLLARALQHEIDHLAGMLFIDRLGPVKRGFFEKRYAREHGLAGSKRG